MASPLPKISEGGGTQTSNWHHITNAPITCKVWRTFDVSYIWCIYTCYNITGDITEEKDFLQDKKYILENFKSNNLEYTYANNQLNAKVIDNIISPPESLDSTSIFDILENEQQEIPNDLENGKEE